MASPRRSAAACSARGAEHYRGRQHEPAQPGPGVGRAETRGRFEAVWELRLGDRGPLAGLRPHQLREPHGDRRLLLPESAYPRRGLPRPGGRRPPDPARRRPGLGGNRRRARRRLPRDPDCRQRPRCGRACGGGGQPALLHALQPVPRGVHAAIRRRPHRLFRGRRPAPVIDDRPQLGREPQHRHQRGRSVHL